MPSNRWTAALTSTASHFYKSAGRRITLPVAQVGSGSTLVVTPQGTDGEYDSVQAAHDAAETGDQILIAPGSYDEALTITKSGLTFVGLAPRGRVSIAPSETNATAITVDGSSARVSGTTFINIGAEGNGTGGGLHVMGDIRRVTVDGGKIEGGAFAIKLESTADGDVADTRIERAELCWTDTALVLAVSGGGDPVTQTLFRHNFLHNYTTTGVLVDTVHSADLWVVENTFAAQEDGSEPTAFIDASVANTTGIITGNRFATTVWSNTLFVLAAGVLFMGNYAQAEGPSTGGGTAGRPD